MDCYKAAVGWETAGNCCQRRSLKTGCCMAAVGAGASTVEEMASPGRKEGCRLGWWMEVEGPCRTDKVSWHTCQAYDPAISPRSGCCSTPQQSCLQPCMAALINPGQQDHDMRFTGQTNRKWCCYLDSVKMSVALQLQKVMLSDPVL